jgi:hypothetical protein
VRDAVAHGARTNDSYGLNIHKFTSRKRLSLPLDAKPRLTAGSKPVSEPGYRRGFDSYGHWRDWDRDGYRWRDRDDWR